MHPRLPALLVSLLLAAPAIAAHAQSSSTGGTGKSTHSSSAPEKTQHADTVVDESREKPPVFATGLTVGVLHFDGGRTDQVVAGVLQLQPVDWFTLSAAPGFGHSTVTAVGPSGAALAGASTSSSGLTDIPISAGVWHSFDATWAPSLGAALLASLSTGDSTSGLGLGRSSTDIDFTVGAQPIDHTNFSLAVIQPLSSASGNGALRLESAFFLGRSTATLSFGNELGSADSGSVLARSVAAGVAYSVAGPLTLTLDGTRGLTRGAPGWSLSLGFGTAFAGISPVGVTSPFRRLSKTFGKKGGGGSGFRHGKDCTTRKC